ACSGLRLFAPGLPFRSPSQGFQLLQAEPPSLTALQAVELNRPDGDAAQAQHLVIQAGQHSADLTVLPLVQDDTQPGAFAVCLQALDALGADVAVTQPD